MSGAAPNKLYSVNFGAIALSASATKSLWLLDPVTNPFAIVEFGVSFNASASSAPVQVDLYVVTSLGTPAGTTGTERALGSTTVAATTTSLTALTTEPTTKVLIQSWYVQPFGGLLEIQYPLGREGASAIGAGNRIGLQCVTPAAVTPTAVGHVWFEE